MRSRGRAQRAEPEEGTDRGIYLGSHSSFGSALGTGARGTALPPGLPAAPLSEKQMTPMSTASMLRPMMPTGSHKYLVRVRVRVRIRVRARVRVGQL